MTLTLAHSKNSVKFVHIQNKKGVMFGTHKVSQLLSGQVMNGGGKMISPHLHNSLFTPLQVVIKIVKFYVSIDVIQ